MTFWRAPDHEFNDPWNSHDVYTQYNRSNDLTKTVTVLKFVNGVVARLLEMNFKFKIELSIH